MQPILGSYDSKLGFYLFFLYIFFSINKKLKFFSLFKNIYIFFLTHSSNVSSFPQRVGRHPLGGVRPKEGQYRTDARGGGRQVCVRQSGGLQREGEPFFFRKVFLFLRVFKSFFLSEKFQKFFSC